MNMTKGGTFIYSCISYVTSITLCCFCTIFSTCCIVVRYVICKAMTKCINCNCFSAEFFVTYSTVNCVIVRTCVYTIRCYLVLYNYRTLGVTKSICFIRYIRIATYSTCICCITIIYTIRCCNYCIIVMSKGRINICSCMCFITSITLCCFCTIFSTCCIVVRYVICE